TGAGDVLERTGAPAGGTPPRLLGRKVPLEVAVCFEERFGVAAQQKQQEEWDRARECARVGRFELAADHYREALKGQPSNWVLLNEVAMFLIFSLRDVKAGGDLARLALGLNPTCSAHPWSTLGDGLLA